MAPAYAFRRIAMERPEPVMFLTLIQDTVLTRQSCSCKDARRSQNASNSRWLNLRINRNLSKYCW